MFEIMEKDLQEAVIKVIGVGGCGGNAIEHMITKNLSGVEFICANTDMQALKKSNAKTILQIGIRPTRSSNPCAMVGCHFIRNLSKS